jgi:hypothetical protein
MKRMRPALMPRSVRNRGRAAKRLAIDLRTRHQGVTMMQRNKKEAPAR